MFGTHFYYQLTRKYVVLMGNMFNQIELVRTNKNTGDEIERIKVPIAYGPKEKYVERLQSDPTLTKETAITLPRLSFEIVGIEYNAQRQQNPLLRSGAANTNTTMASQYMGVPYDLDFDVNLYTRNIDDGTQIIEQILPYFSPGYTVTMNSIPELGFLKDIPIILNSVRQDTQYEGNYDTTRLITWTLNFSVKAYYYGPIQTPKIIRKVITNIYNDPSLRLGNIITINTGTGNGTFQIDEVVYQGNTNHTATAYGIVLNWSSITDELRLGGCQGTFRLNIPVKGTSSNANYTVDSFLAAPLKLTRIEITPDPIDADPDDDFGYTTTITENVFGNENI
jgi:T4-like virus Myoviridae tail sheath stabiliser